MLYTVQYYYTRYNMVRVSMIQLVVLVGNELENIHCTCVCIARSGLLID